jgi:hypothetical protein
MINQMSDTEDDMPYLMPTAAAAAAQQHQTLNAYPLCFHNTILEAELINQECSDGIYLSTEMFRYFNRVDSDELVIIKLTKDNKTAYGHIIGTHMDDSASVYIPPWMCQFLDADCGDPIQVTQYKDCRIGLNIRIQPHESFYATLEDPSAALRDAFEHYTVIQASSEIPLLVNGRQLIVSIIDTDSMGPICIRGMELTVNIDTPLDYVEPLASTAVEAVNTLQEPVDLSSMLPDSLLKHLKNDEDKRFPGAGRVLGSFKK